MVQHVSTFLTVHHQAKHILYKFDVILTVHRR